MWRTLDGGKVRLNTGSRIKDWRPSQRGAQPLPPGRASGADTEAEPAPAGGDLKILFLAGVDGIR